jgi:hypothetical protein
VRDIQKGLQIFGKFPGKTENLVNGPGPGRVKISPFAYVCEVEWISPKLLRSLISLFYFKYYLLEITHIIQWLIETSKNSRSFVIEFVSVNFFEIFFENRFHFEQDWKSLQSLPALTSFGQYWESQNSLILHWLQRKRLPSYGRWKAYKLLPAYGRLKSL